MGASGYHIVEIALPGAGSAVEGNRISVQPLQGKSSAALDKFSDEIVDEGFCEPLLVIIASQIAQRSDTHSDI